MLERRVLHQQKILIVYTSQTKPIANKNQPFGWFLFDIESGFAPEFTAKARIATPTTIIDDRVSLDLYPWTIALLPEKIKSI